MFVNFLTFIFITEIFFMLNLNAKKQLKLIFALKIRFSKKKVDINVLHNNINCRM